MSDRIVILEAGSVGLAASLSTLGFDVVPAATLAVALVAAQGADGVVTGHDVPAADVEALRRAGCPRGVFQAPEKHPLTDFRKYWLRGTAPRVLAFSGSARKDSFNARLLSLAVERLKAAGVAVTVFDHAAHVLPLYNGDLEVGGALPDAVHAVQRVFFLHHGLLLAAPEYNGFPTPLLKNTLDWASRSSGGASGGSTFAGTVAGLVSASAGPGAGGRVRPLVRKLLGNLRMDVVEPELGVGRASGAFDDAGQLKDAEQTQALDAVVRAVVDGIAERSAASE